MFIWKLIFWIKFYLIWIWIKYYWFSSFELNCLNLIILWITMRYVKIITNTIESILIIKTKNIPFNRFILANYNTIFVWNRAITILLTLVKFINIYTKFFKFEISGLSNSLFQIFEIISSFIKIFSGTLINNSIKRNSFFVNLNILLFKKS